MEELVVTYGQPKGNKVLFVAIGTAITVCGLMIIAKQIFDKQYDILLVSGVFNTIFGISISLRHTVWKYNPLVKINNEIIQFDFSGNKKTSINWVDVSKVNIGVSYINFLLNGEQKEQKLNLSGLIYNDLKSVKSKIIELCEHKNISYNND